MNKLEVLIKTLNEIASLYEEEELDYDEVVQNAGDGGNHSDTFESGISYGNNEIYKCIKDALEEYSNSNEG